MTRFAQCIVAALLLIGCASGAPAPPNGPARWIEFRIADREPREGYTALEYEGSPLYLAPLPVVSDTDFLDVRAVERDEYIVLEVAITPATAARVKRATADNIGGRMAFLIDSGIVSAAVIMSGVGTDRFQVAVPHAVAEATRLAERVRERWPGDSRFRL